METKTGATLALALSLLTLGSLAQAQQAGAFGVGVVGGDPTGLTLKYWSNDWQAVDAGVGFSGDAALYADFLWHSWTILPQPQRGKLGGYVGLGPRIETKSDAQFGIRTMAGASYWVDQRPIEVFIEAGPVFRLAPDRTVDVDGGVGVRFYFGR